MPAAASAVAATAAAAISAAAATAISAAAAVAATAQLEELIASRRNVPGFARKGRRGEGWTTRRDGKG